MTTSTRPSRAKTKTTTEAAPAPEHDEQTPTPEGPVGSGAVALPADIIDGAEIVTLPDGRTMRRNELEARLAALTAPFPASMVEKLPKVLSKNDSSRYECRTLPNGNNPASKDGHACGGYHAFAIHLDYIGHAGITERLNSVDPFWDWEFQHVDLPAWVDRSVQALYATGEIAEAKRLIKQHGIPVSRDGGYWMTVTVLGITHKGFGDANGKSGTNATKEVIGDGIRNAGIRFGLATYLWSKSDHALALRTGNDSPAADAPERPALTEDLFRKAVADALTRRDTAAYLEQFGNTYGVDAMRALTVTARDGKERTGFDVLNELIAHHTGTMTSTGAQTHLGDAHAQGDARTAPVDQWDTGARTAQATPDAQDNQSAQRAPADAQDDEGAREQERAQQEARAQDERAQEEARVAAVREQERAQAAAAQQKADEARAAAAARADADQVRQDTPERMKLVRTIDELSGQAGVLGVTLEAHVHDLLHDPRAPKGLTIQTVGTQRLRTWAARNRASVVAELRAQGRASEAEAYVLAAQRADGGAYETWLMMTAAPAHEDAPERAQQDALNM